MGKTMVQEPNASKGKESLKGTARKTVGASLSVALLVAPLSFTSVMAADAANPEGLVDIDVSKSWIGEVGEEAHLNILANGVEVDEITLTPETGWDYTFENLPIVSEDDGEPVVYTVTEDNAEGYDTQISGDQDLGFIVSNIQANSTALADDGVLDGTVAITYKNQDGDTIAFMDVTRGKTGEKYNIVPKVIPGHDLIDTEGDTSGTFAAGVNKQVVFTYQFDPEYTPENPEDGYIEGIIEARYVNQDGDEIALREKSTGEVRSAYALNSKTIQGYTFDRIEGVDEGTELLFEEGSQVVTYVYNENANDEKPVIGMVVTKHVNEQGEEIADRVRVSGEIDAAYETAALEIDGYEFVEVKGDVSGKFAQGITIIEYVYKESVVDDGVPKDDETPKDEKPVVEKPKEEPAVETPKEKPVKEPVVAESKFIAMYEALDFGFTYEEAVMIVGTDGTMDAGSQGMINGEVVAGVAVYTWTTDDGDVLTLGFLNDKLVSKSLIADGNSWVEYDYETKSDTIKDGDVTPTPIVADGKDAKDSNFKKFYDSVEYGMSYKEAVAIIGSEGQDFDMNHEAFADMDLPEDTEMYWWRAENGDTMVLAFVRDKLVAKAANVGGVEYVDEASEDEIIAMMLADNKLSDDEKVKAREEVLEGKKLADTATNTFNLIAIGVGLLLAAGAGLFAVNRRRQITDSE